MVRRATDAARPGRCYVQEPVRAVCPRCQSVCEAGAPSPAPPSVCRECGEALPPVPEGDATGLVKREERLPDGARVLLLPRPREPAVRALVVAFAWNSLVASALTVAWLNDGGTVLLLLTVLLSAGLGATYFAARGLANHVRVEVGPRGLRVEERPLPPTGALSHPPRALLGFAVHATGWASAPRVHVLLRDGRALPLPFAFARQEHAAWVADALQQSLDEARATLPYR